MNDGDMGWSGAGWLEPKPMHPLEVEYHKWMEEQKLTLASTEELLREAELTDEQRTWLTEFQKRWDVEFNQSDSKLMYHGMEMRLEPINVPMYLIASELNKNNPSLALLEPGDGTRYEIILVPCWSSNIRLGLASNGIRPTDAKDYVLCVKINGIQTSFFATEHVQEYDIEGVNNDWTCRFLAWWLRHLWLEINKDR